MTQLYAFTVSVRGLRPQTRLPSARGAVQGCASNATQTVLDRRTQDRTAALALEIDDPGAGRWEALRRDPPLGQRVRLGRGREAAGRAGAQAGHLETGCCSLAGNFGFQVSRAR